MTTETFKKARSLFDKIRDIDYIIESYQSDKLSSSFEFRRAGLPTIIPESISDNIISILKQHRIELQKQFEQL